MIVLHNQSVFQISTYLERFGLLGQTTTSYLSHQAFSFNLQFTMTATNQWTPAEQTPLLNLLIGNKNSLFPEVQDFCQGHVHVHVSWAPCIMFKNIHLKFGPSTCTYH